MRKFIPMKRHKQFVILSTLTAYHDPAYHSQSPSTWTQSSHTMLFKAPLLSLLSLSHLPFALGAETSFLTSPLLGDFAKVEDMDPTVVINFLADCTDVPIDVSSCLVTNFVDAVFSRGQWGDQCELDYDLINRGIRQAVSRCSTVTNFAEAKTLFAILSTPRCSQQLCEEKSFYKIESAWMKDCADINLPSPLTQTAGSVHVVPSEKDVTLSCMLQFAMTTPASQFGLHEPRQGSQELCYPPGYEIMNSFCYQELGYLAVQKCAPGEGHAARIGV